MSEHTWFQENLAAFSAGGLSGDERERLERHRIACATCAQELRDFQGWDSALDNLFDDVRPVPGWENQVIAQLRAAPRWGSLRLSPWVRVAGTAAAVVFLGILGAVLYGFVHDGTLPFPGMPWAASPGVTVASETVGVLDDSRVQKEGRELRELERVSGEAREDLFARSHGSMVVNPANSDLAQKLSENLREFNTDALTDIDGEKKGGVTELKREAGPENTFSFKLLDAPPQNLPALARGGEVNQSDRDGTSLFLGKEESGSKAYFNPPMSVMTGAGDKDSGVLKAEPARAGSKEANLGEKGKDTLKNQPPDKKPAEPGIPPAQAQRKLIRTGEIEFEVDGFDSAVAGISRLVNAVRGGFIATVNSDKLENGKVRGSLIVRLPPENLDRFLIDLRQELAKTGELKSQRIGSQDVTKQYTDIESRLRSARVMEERFLQIIKTGKGDIKDLVAAENALGMWRTKIEEMEGEIRYYSNQVALSTLTITLTEKEIQAPAALVVTERIKMQIEVDDVHAARKAALAAVADAKGRVTKSDLKQHAAGQLEAILHFEVAPAGADAVRDRLKQLGNVTHQDADRSQQTEGNGRFTRDIKIKENDVKFEVGLYNVANVQPREVLVIQLASPDVAAGFRKLQEVVAKAHGQVRSGQLNEQDKLNISAQFDFDVPAQERKGIDLALAEAGKVSSRTVTQAPPGQAATDRKVGFRLTLRNAAVLPARERISLGIDVNKDVDQTATAIIDHVKTQQGRVGGVQSNHERNGRVSALLIFDVPLTAKDELIRQLKDAGIVRLQTATRNPQVPDNELATAHFEVTLTSSGPIVPSDEGIWPQVRTGLFYSFKLLTWSLLFLILGVSVVLPWALLLWGGYKIIMRLRRKPAV